MSEDLATPGGSSTAGCHSAYGNGGSVHTATTPHTPVPGSSTAGGGGSSAVGASARAPLSTAGDALDAHGGVKGAGLMGKAKHGGATSDGWCQVEPPAPDVHSGTGPRPFGDATAGSSGAGGAMAMGATAAAAMAAATPSGSSGAGLLGLARTLGAANADLLGAHTMSGPLSGAASLLCGSQGGGASPIALSPGG